MEPSFSQRLKRLFDERHDLELELVFTAIGIASIAIAIFAGYHLGMSGGQMVASIPVVFVAQSICLLFRATMWIPAAFGILVLGGFGALVGWLATVERAEWLQWVGAGLGFLLVGALPLWCYRSLVKMLWAAPDRR